MLGQHGNVIRVGVRLDEGGSDVIQRRRLTTTTRHFLRYKSTKFIVGLAIWTVKS